jgi:hypothetical protein
MPKLKIRPRPAKSRPEVVTGSFGLHYEEVVQRRPLLVVLLAVGLVFFAVIIPVAIYHSFASGDFFAAETESGTLSSASLVTKVSDATASGGSYIAFKLPSCPSGQQGTWPNCTPIPQTCPAGQQGTPPNCTTPPVAACTSIAVPAYFYPPSYWAQATSGTPAVKILILDPTTTGAGTSKDPNYATVAANAKAAGIHVLGYADSAYGARSMSELKTEADHYKSWYGVTDMFIDEESPDAADLPYYQQIADYVHATNGAIIMFNPGDIPNEGYAKIADIVAVFENTYTAWQSFKPPAWFSKYPASRFYAIVYNVPNATNMATVLDLARQRSMGYTYATNDNLPNPWDTLPPYWQQEVDNIKQACAGT